MLSDWLVLLCIFFPDQSCQFQIPLTTILSMIVCMGIQLLEGVVQGDPLHAGNTLQTLNIATLVLHPT